MMIRELMMNAIEAARLAPETENSVLPVEVTAKFAIWNAGPGMDDDELLEISNTRLPSARKKSDEQLWKRPIERPFLGSFLWVAPGSADRATVRRVC
jgi:hypothetical protein